MLIASTSVRACVLLAAIPLAAFAQKTTGEIKGTVQDPGNAFVPKAAIAAQDKSTGISYRTVSANDGTYLVPNLLPGTYSVTVTATGFETSVLNSVVVETGRTVDLPVHLT